MKILIADDDPVSLRILQGALEQWGYEVVLAKDGTEAWGALTTSAAPQMVILDWMMPGMDGLTICRRIRATSRGRVMYLILVTARTDRLDVVAGLEAGANDYVLKPYDRASLEEKLGQVGLL